MKNQLTLLELNLRIREAMQEAFPGTLWLVAEISEMKVNRSGHCYLELVEKDAVSDEITARARATIWSYTFRMLRAYFETITGQQFTEGLKVLIQVTVEYHPAYGISLNIKDIDPAYTIGDMVRRRREIIDKLREAGVFDMNRELTLPLVPQRVAVISSLTAAGFQDFSHQLDNNPYKFRFFSRLFEATMQGSEAVPSILAALDTIFREEEKFDVVVIIRGGGAQADLSCFDNYDLAYTVAQFPLPVITGIGHEKDFTILDMVAHTRLKTPTAVAEFLISGVNVFYEKLINHQQTLTDTLHTLLDKQSLLLKEYADRVNYSAGKYLNIPRHRLIITGLRFKKSINNYTTVQTETLFRFRSRLSKQSALWLRKHQNSLSRIRHDAGFLWKTQIIHKKRVVHQLGSNFRISVKARLIQAEKEWSVHSTALRHLDPQNILLRGFSMALQQGKIIKSVHSVDQTEELETRFHDGSVFSKILKTGIPDKPK